MRYVKRTDGRRNRLAEFLKARRTPFSGLYGHSWEAVHLQNPTPSFPNPVEAAPYPSCPLLLNKFLPGHIGFFQLTWLGISY
jgi:hypothetical protein